MDILFVVSRNLHSHGQSSTSRMILSHDPMGHTKSKNSLMRSHKSQTTIHWTNYITHTDISFVSVVSVYMYSKSLSKSNTTRATSGTGTAYPSGEHEVIPV